MLLSDDRTTFRPLSRSGSLRSSDELGSKPVKIQRSPNNRIPRRFFIRKSGPEHLTKSDKISVKSLDRIRMDHKLGEINLGSNSQIRLPRDYMGYQKGYKIYQFKEGTKNRRSSTSDTRSSALDLEKSEVVAGPASICRFCGLLNCRLMQRAVNRLNARRPDQIPAISELFATWTGG